MSNQKKAVIVIVILAIVFVGSILSGTFLVDNERRKPDKKTAESYVDDLKETLKNNTWLESPMARYTPSLSPDTIHYVQPTTTPPPSGMSPPPDICTFTIDADDEDPFRSLKLSIERLQGVTDDNEEKETNASVTYTSKASTKNDLKNQSFDFKFGSEDNSDTTIAVLTDGGDLELTPHAGYRLSMHYKGEKIWICKKSIRGEISVNPDFK